VNRKDIYEPTLQFETITMSKTKSYLAILMGVIIIIVDLWWTVTSTMYLPWVVAGVVILVASVVWIYLDYDLMKK
jgi:hypothetical protein